MCTHPFQCPVRGPPFFFLARPLTAVSLADLACLLEQRGKNALDIARDRGYKDVEDRLFTLTEPRSRVRVSVHPPPRPYNIM